MIEAIHRFWMGDSIPHEYWRFGGEWLALNPGFLLYQWGWEDVREGRIDIPSGPFEVIQDIVKRDAGRDGIEKFVQIADVVGYCLVAQHGGIYVNCDIQPVRPLAGRIPTKAWASYENDEDWRIVNAAIGAPEPSDAFWTGLLDGLADRYFSNPGAEMVETTGPAYLTDYAKAHPHELAVLPVESFNPVHWKQIAAGGDASEYVARGEFSERTIGVHHWGHKKDGRSNTVETATRGIQ